MPCRVNETLLLNGLKNSLCPFRGVGPLPFAVVAESSVFHLFVFVFSDVISAKRERRMGSFEAKTNRERSLEQIEKREKKIKENERSTRLGWKTVFSTRPIAILLLWILHDRWNRFDRSRRCIRWTRTIVNISVVIETICSSVAGMRNDRRSNGSLRKEGR